MLGLSSGNTLTPPAASAVTNSLRQATSPEAKEAALQVVKEVEAALQSEIQAVPWMGAATKEQALTKLHTIANKIGYPDTWRDYSTLEIVRGDEIGNSERASWFEFHRWLAKIGKPVDRKEWDMTPLTVNAYYDPQKNDINFPAGVLQPRCSARCLMLRPTMATPAPPWATN